MVHSGKFPLTPRLSRRTEASVWNQSLLASLGSAAALWAVEAAEVRSGEDLRLLAVNLAWEALFKVPATQVVGLTLAQLFPEFQESWVDRFRYVALTGDAAEAKELLPDTGQWVEVRLQRPEPGRVLVLLGEIDEIRKRGRGLEVMSMAVEQNPASIIITDAQGTIEYVNRKFEAVTGYTRQEAIGLNPRILKSGNQSEEVYQDLWRTISSGRTWTGELLNKRKDGSFYWERAHISPMVENGQVLNYLAIKEDISKEKALRLGGERLMAALEEMGEAVATVSLEGRITYANPAFTRLTACACREDGTFDEGKSGTLSSLLGEVGERMVHPRLEGAQWREEFPFQAADGSHLTLIGTCSWVARGPGLEWVVVLRDVTLEIERERNFRQAEKMDALGALASGIAHDFNNVLTVILSAAELIDWQTPEDSPLKAKVNAIKLASQRAKELNRRILTYGRKGGEVRIPFDLTSLTKEVLFLLRSAVPAGVDLRHNLASSVWTVGDSNQIHQVVMNLAVNGFQAMEEQGGVLELSLEEAEVGADELPAGMSQGRYSILTVADQGCGMSKEVQARAMEPFFTTKKQTGGSGMGLFVVHNIVAAHKGFIRIESQPGQGTTLKVYLPFAELASGVEPQVEGSDPVGEEDLLILGGDDLEIALLAEGLKQLGYQVARKSISEESFQHLQDHPPTARAIILRSTKSGIPADVCIHRLRKIAGHLPIIMLVEPNLSAMTTGESKGHYDDFVMKPATPADVARVVRRVLANWNPVDHPAPGPGSQSKRYGASDKPTVLLAEDSGSTRGLIRSWLVKAGYTVWEAKNGQEAWNRFEAAGEREIALVLTDIEMPVMDGLELVDRIRNIAPNVPVAILSSVEDAEAHKKALRLRVNEFLEKPFSSEVLLDRVRQLIEEHGAMDKVRRSTETVQSVRMAQRAMVAVPEPDLPIYTLSEPLTDAGGDVFRCYRQEDGSIVFVLADVVGHSVLSSYAVASFLGMLSSFLSDEAELRRLAVRLNKVVQNGPFAEIPICAVFGHWHPALGRLHILNAGIPWGLHLNTGLGQVQEIQVNGTPLGLFPELEVEERVLWLRPGDRLLFGTDGVFEATGVDGARFDATAPETWSGLAQAPIEQALGYFCVAALAFANGRQSDDVLAIAFEQGPIQDDCALHLHVPSTAHAIDAVCARVSLLLSEIAEVRPVAKEKAFNLLLALREAMTNAVFHGNGGRPGSQIFLRCEQNPDGRFLTITVADEGRGFPLESHQAPTDPLSERGRGLPLIQSFADHVSMTAGELCMRFAVGYSATERLLGDSEELT